MSNTLARLLACFLATFLFQSGPSHAQDSYFQIGAGGIKGIYFPLAKRLCRLINDNVRVHGQRCGIAATAGSQENLAGLAEGLYTFALVQSNSLLVDAEGGGPTPYRTVAALYAEPIHVVVRQGGEVDDIADLAEVTVNVGDMASGTTLLAEALLEAAGIVPGEVSTQRFGPDQQARRLCQGDVAALIFVSGIRNSSMTEVHQRCGVRMMSIPPDVTSRLGANVPGLVPIIIPANTYPDQIAPVQSVGPIARLVTSADTPNALVAIMTKALSGAFGNFTDVHPALRDFDGGRLQPLFRGELYHAGIISRPRSRPENIRP